MFICVAQVLGARTDCRQCKAGHYAKRHCNEFHDTICAQCPEGTYTPKSNTRELCFSCSTCRKGFFEIKSCTFRQDTLCGSCSQKEYSDRSSYRIDCVHDRKEIQNDQPRESTTEESIDLGSGDGELIINRDGVKPTVIDDVFIEKESQHVTSLPHAQNETLDTEGSGEGFPISVSPEEEYEPTDQNVTFTTSTESMTTSEQPLIVTQSPTSLPETLNTTAYITTSSTDSTSSDTEYAITLEQSSVALSTSEQISTSTSTSTFEPTSFSTTVKATEPMEKTETPTPEPTSEPSTPTPQTTTSTTTTTTMSTTSSTTEPEITTTIVQTTPEPTTPTTKTKPLRYSTDKDGMVIIDLRGSTIIDLRTTPTPRPKYKVTTVKTIDLDSGDNGIVIDLGKQEEDFIDLPDNSLKDTETKDKSPLIAGALGSKKMDEDDGVKIGIVVAVVIVAAIIFFVVGFLVSRYCRKKRSGSFRVKNDIENGSAKGSTPNVLDYRDGGIYDEIDKDSATPDKNGKPNGTARSTEDVYAVPDKRKSNPPESPKLEEQLDKIKFIDDTEEEAEAKEDDKLLEDSDEKYSSFASIPNGSVKQNGDVTSNDYVSESSPILNSRDTPENKEPSDEEANGKESEDAEESPLLEKAEGGEKQAETSS